MKTLKLALGTVQFGLPYGINNKNGQVSPKSIQSILAFAQSVGIDVLDTAFLYGESERNLGEVGITDFKIVSKLPPCSAAEVPHYFEQSLSRLKIAQLYGYLFHHFSTFEQDNKVLEALLLLKQQGKIQKIGFSLYHPKELEYLLEKQVPLDLVQVPYNIFDRRFEPYFSVLKQQNVEIHTRSAFLQGLLLKKIADVPSYFETVLPKLQHLQDLSVNYQLDRTAICLNFVVNQPHIDKVVIGVDDLQQLQHNIAALQHVETLKEFISALDFLQTDEETIINPARWQI